MSNREFDIVIVGGGIAGLLSALRFARRKMKVVVIEKDKIGSGMTLANHGTVHSGIMYINRHEHIVRQCQEAQAAFSVFAKDAELVVDDSLYIATPEVMAQATQKLDYYNMPYHKTALDKHPELVIKNLKDREIITFHERVFSSKKILEITLKACLAEGVKIVTGTKVTRILTDRGQVTGVSIGIDQHIPCSNVILANGLGVVDSLKSINSYYHQFLKSRLSMMVHLPKSPLSRGIIFAELGKPIILPTVNGASLASIFGDEQPRITNDRKFPVDFSKADNTLKAIKQYVNKPYVDTDYAQFYTCGKVDYVGEDNSKHYYVDPGFHILDHQKHDSINGLFSIITGKMTLGFHVSKSIVDRVLNVNDKLIINSSPDSINTPSGMLDSEPWQIANKS